MTSAKYHGLYKYLKNGCTYKVVSFVNYRPTPESDIKPMVVLEYCKNKNGDPEYSPYSNDAILLSDFCESGQFVLVDESGNKIIEDDAPKVCCKQAPKFTYSIWYQ